MDYPNIFKALETVLSDNAFTINYLRKDNEELTAKNAELKLRIEELERELEEAKF